MKAKKVLGLVVLFMVAVFSAATSWGDVTKAQAKLATAQVHLLAGNHERVLALAEEAIGEAPDDLKVRQDARSLIESVLTAKKAAEEKSEETARETAENERLKKERLADAKLEEARRLLSEGKADDARALIKLEELEGEQLERARAFLEDSHPGWLPRKLRDIWHGWFGDSLIVFVALALIWWLLAFARDVYPYRGWVIDPVDDQTKLSLGDGVLSSLDHWISSIAPTSAGLLWLAPPEVSSMPNIQKAMPTINLAEAFGALPKVGGVTVQAVAGIVTALPGWLQARRPRISVVCQSNNDNVTIQLSSRDRHGHVRTVREQSAKDIGKTRKAIETATYKMYYLIAKGATPAEAEGAEKLRQGLGELRRYLTEGQGDALEKAHEIFADVRAAHPAILEASLHEGMALDLLEKHEEAREIFKVLGQLTDGELKEKARYNEAVALFRQYRPDALKETIVILDKAYGKPKKVDKGELKYMMAKPMKAFILAAKANAIAHKPLFWQELVREGQQTSDQEGVVLERKRAQENGVRAWLTEVEKSTHQLGDVADAAEKSQRTPWDAVSLRQLRWAIHNARGNVYLNTANNFYSAPYVDPETEPKIHRGLLGKAYNEFKLCEAILRPGVETLTNLATVLLALERLPEARECAERAIGLNPLYEYAYYRLAQIWEAEENVEKVCETLRSLPKSPTFLKRMFEKYEIALEYPR